MLKEVVGQVKAAFSSSNSGLPLESRGYKRGLWSFNSLFLNSASSLDESSILIPQRSGFALN